MPSHTTVTPSHIHTVIPSHTRPVTPPLSPYHILHITSPVTYCLSIYLPGLAPRSPSRLGNHDHLPPITTTLEYLRELRYDPYPSSLITIPCYHHDHLSELPSINPLSNSNHTHTPSFSTIHPINPLSNNNNHTHTPTHPLFQQCRALRALAPHPNIIALKGAVLTPLRY